jgi:hypothetical protein
LPNYQWQNLLLALAAPLQRFESVETSSMPTIKDIKLNLQEKSPHFSVFAAKTHEDSPRRATHAVIELGDLTSGPEAEFDRLKSTVNTMSAAIDQIRNDHARLASDYQKLTNELREIKLVLAKVHAKELRAVERRHSW